MGRRRGGGVWRARDVRFQTAISQKRLEITITLSIWYANSLGAQALSIGKGYGALSSWRSYKRESGSKLDFGFGTTKMVGNDSSHHLKMFGEVSKPL